MSGHSSPMCSGTAWTMANSAGACEELKSHLLRLVDANRTGEELGVTFPLLSAGFHGEYTLYRECHHFPWIVGQQERK